MQQMMGLLDSDSHFPIEPPDKFKAYPPTPESIAPDADWFSRFQRELAENDGIVKNGAYQGAAKLIPHLHKHEEYATRCHNFEIH